MGFFGVVFLVAVVCLQVVVVGWFANWSWCVVLTVVACYKMLRVGALLVFVRFRFRWWFGLQRVTLVLVVC